MKRIIRFVFFLFLFAFSFSILCAQKNPAKKKSHFKISQNKPDSLNIKIDDDEESVDVSDSTGDITLSDSHDLVEFTNPWKIKAGDDSLWAAQNYDDSNWFELKGDSAEKELERGGITWYRMHFTIDSSLMNQPLAFILRQFGSAADAYLDGKFLKSYGKVGKNKEDEVAELSFKPKPFPFVFSNDTNHVLAVRYSNFHLSDVLISGINKKRSFRVSIKNLNEEIADASDPSKYFSFVFFAAIFITLAVVHFVMFIYYSQKITNLYYSLYCFSIFLIVFYLYYVFTTTDYSSIAMLSKTTRYIVPLLVIPLVAMLHSVFYERVLKVFWFLLGLYILSLAGIILNYDKAATIVVVVLFMVSIVEIMRVIIRALVKRKDGSWIFALAILLTPISAIVSGFLPDQFVISGLKIPNNTAAIVISCFVLGLPFSMTLYLARDFARMSKKLKVQLKEITDLSDKTIEQEKEKKHILENQKSELEIKVVERTQEVWQQKEVIETKNKEITDSLIYAKRIQSAILPDIKLIYEALKQSFIFYLPKDIVSGDFYGFAQKNEKVLIAAADCTGHGVAGAFMSMIGSSLLNQIINEKKITDPALILDKLNEGIIQSLKQKDSESNDGMDISICTFDFKNYSLQFAGANRPLWLIRNNELLAYKPNKFPIGGLQILHDEKFKQHEIKLQQNDSIYIFSDGFADQFGGEKGKKMMSKNFRELLLSIQSFSMREQENHLKDHFEKWKRNYEQVDDVLVIGIRV
jgi:serine phosphatase RsbU (regulator of sigma subunit)